MFGVPERESEYHRSRKYDSAHDGPVQSGGSSIVGTGLATLSRLAESAGIGASYNAPVRAEAMHGMQQTHGNRAVQRYFAGSEGAGAGSGLPFGLGDLMQRGGQALGQIGEYGQMAQEQAARSMVSEARDFGGDMASSFLGGTPLAPMLGIPEEKSFLSNLPLIGGLAERGAELGGSVLNTSMDAVRTLGAIEQPNTRDTPLPLAGIPFVGAPDVRGLLDYGREMEGGGTGFGWEPSKAGEGVNPYAYAKVNEYGGQEIGAALQHEEREVLGIPIIEDFLYGADKQGTYETDNGDTRSGMLLNGGLYRKQFNPGGAVSADGELLTGGYELSAGTDGMTANIGYNLAAASASVGKPSQDSHTDAQVRLGVSAGLSGAFRTHWGDKDVDGYPEYGIGVDIGILSGDFKTEDPMGALVRGGLNFIPGANQLYDSYMSDTNLTHGTSMEEDKAAVLEGKADEWSDRMRAGDEEDFARQMAPMPSYIPWQQEPALPEKDPYAEDAGYFDMGPYEEGGSKVPGWEW